jgi:hypothetical protein
LTAAGFIAACAMAFTRKAGHRRAASSVSRGGN